MKNTVLFCVLLAAAATANEKTVRRVAVKEKASSKFKQDVEAPNRPNPTKPFPDTPRAPDLDFIKMKVAELVKDFHIDQEQADMVRVILSVSISTPRSGYSTAPRPVSSVL